MRELPTLEEIQAVSSLEEMEIMIDILEEKTNEALQLGMNLTLLKYINKTMSLRVIEIEMEMV